MGSKSNEASRRLCPVLLAMVWGNLSCPAQITLKADFTSPSTARQPMHFHWDVYNRISPKGEISIPDNRKNGICMVRPLGGTATGDRKNLEEDTYKWDGTRYFYDWAPLKEKINNVLAKERVHQLMIDNVPWAFQRGVDRKGFPEIDTYGNAWPPNDPEAWSAYIKAMFTELFRTYGRPEVAQWRFCIGREIGTGGHWRAGRDAFFEHYRNTEKAIHAMLPEAKVGAHFLWASATNSYGPEFVKWCKANGTRYDFIGVSYYPFYDRENRVNLDQVYRVDFAPIKDQADWNPAATLEIHEFALIKSINSAGNDFVSAESRYQESFRVLLAKRMYDNDLTDLFQWGSNLDSPSIQAFSDMAESIYHESSRSGTPRLNGAMVDAVFGREPALRKYRAIAAHYHANPAAATSEPVVLVAKIPAPAGTGIRYRSAAYRPASHLAPWSEWMSSKTAEGDGGDHSLFSLEANLEPFTFFKFEMIADSETSGVRVAFDARDNAFLSMTRGKGGALLTACCGASSSCRLELHDLAGRQVRATRR